MALILGLDTSNYTTSAAIFDTIGGAHFEAGNLLPVEHGKRGLRQSDAVFHHVRQLPEVLDDLKTRFGAPFKPDIVCCSSSPTTADGSYMPCFLAGVMAAHSISASTDCELIKTSHQIGHVCAALYSADKLSLYTSGESFLSFHVSGGTTDCLLCKKDGFDLKISLVSKSLDLKAGQAIDRVGVMLGLDFPCGIELEKLAKRSEASFNPRIFLKNGCCSLSGVENKCSDMKSRGCKDEDIALYCLLSALNAVSEMTKYQRLALGDLPIIYAGGVMSNQIIKDGLQSRFGDVYFAAPQLSRDNAFGVCVYAALKKGLIK